MRWRVAAAIGFFPLLVAACNGDNIVGASAASSIPCDVEQVLQHSCQGCHADTPKSGAPMSLMTSDDVHATAKSNASLPVYEMMKNRINDEARPMPPIGELSDQDRATLNAWLDRGAPPAEEDAHCGHHPPPPDPEVGPEFLPCTPSHTFVAHRAGSDERFEVPPDAGNLYECFTFRSTFGASTQGIAYAPIIDDARVVHHWILYSTSTEQVDGGVGPCNMPQDATFVAGWAPGGRNSIMPADIGLEMPAPEQNLILQIHYHNGAGYTDAADASGVAFCTTETPRTHEAGIVTLGDVVMEIPVDAVGHNETGTCPSWATRLLAEPLNVIGAFPHMHQLGRKMVTEVYRNGSPSNRTTITRVERFDFNSQVFYGIDPSITIHPGDSITTTCTYDNPTGRIVKFGERTEDEMCFNFVMLYPISAVGVRNCGLL